MAQPLARNHTKMDSEYLDKLLLLKSIKTGHKNKNQKDFGDGVQPLLSKKKTKS